MKKYQVIDPYLDFVVDEFSTMEKAEKFINKCVNWDKKHPQGYIPSYKIEKRMQTEES